MTNNNILARPLCYNCTVPAIIVINVITGLTVREVLQLQPWFSLSWAPDGRLQGSNLYFLFRLGMRVITRFGFFPWKDFFCPNKPATDDWLFMLQQFPSSVNSTHCQTLIKVLLTHCVPEVIVLLQDAGMDREIGKPTLFFFFSFPKNSLSETIILLLLSSVAEAAEHAS